MRWSNRYIPCNAENPSAYLWCPGALLTDLKGKGDAVSCWRGRGRRLSRGRDDALRRKLSATQMGGSEPRNLDDAKT